MSGADAATLPDAVSPDVIDSANRLPALIERARGKLAEAPPRPKRWRQNTLLRRRSTMPRSRVPPTRRTPIA